MNESTGILFVHAFPADASMWDAQKTAFMDRKVVAPSLPGFGFSFRPHQPRLNRFAMADLFAALMTEVLGYQRFAAQGGDIGAQVTMRLAAAHPDHLYGIHLNFIALRDLNPGNPTDEERQYFEELQHWLTEETGY